MKRIISLMLACLLIGASLAGCGSGKTPDSGNTGIETTGSANGGQTNAPSSSTTTPETEPPIDPNAVAEVILGQNACVMFTDQTAVLSVVAKNGNGAVLTDVKVQCSLADATVAQAVQSGDTVTVTPQKAGRTKLTVTADGGVSAEATVTVLQFYADSALKPFSDAPEYLSNIILYRRSMMENPGVSRANAEAYAKVLEQYADLFPQAQVSMLVAPKSSILYQDDPYLGAKLNDQTAIIDTIYGFCSDRIKTIPTAAPILEHSDDYLFFYSDHHWTSLGAYYAYASMARTLGWEPADISDEKHRISGNPVLLLGQGCPHQADMRQHLSVLPAEQDGFHDHLQQKRRTEHLFLLLYAGIQELSCEHRRRQPADRDHRQGKRPIQDNFGSQGLLRLLLCALPYRALRHHRGG